MDQLNKWPLLDIVRRRNPFLVWLNKKGYYSATTSMVPHLVGHLSKRLALASSPKELQDLMRDVLESKKQHPEVVTDRAILGIAVALSTAGSDTTAITLSMLLYYLMTAPSAYKRLQQEIDSLFSGKAASATSFAYNDVQQLPYLDSCIKETFRMHPGSSNFQERIVPAEGAKICGEFVSGGTIVGCSAVVVNRNKGVFGSNADVWCPERWLKCNAEDRSKMAGKLFHFGAGSSQCLGKNIALVEVYKVIPVLLRNFKVSLGHAQDDGMSTNQDNRLNLLIRASSRALRTAISTMSATSRLCSLEDDGIFARNDSSRVEDRCQRKIVSRYDLRSTRSDERSAMSRMEYAICEPRVKT